MNMMKKICFDKQDKKWDCCKFYKIYIKNDIKTIRMIGMTDRCPMEKSYLSWICTYYDDNCEMPLEDFLLWDVYYQLDQLTEKSYDVEMEPYDCFEQANAWVKGDGNGSTFKKLLDLTNDTFCGYYYGY